MNFVRITYTGRKIYRDRATGYIWQPGEEKLVSEAIARPLLKFVEFSRTADLKAEEAKAPAQEQGAEVCAELPADLSEQDVAELEQQALDDRAREEDSQREAMLITVQGMNKASLVEYARKYDTTFPATTKVDDMRIAVNGLIHQFGVR
ncbi:hypothetical protein V8Z74_19590 [Comamonas sp. w2-DMI]|uniref:hypothetical protein n=1 Tax=Comamonas sp. w2-DMI TaxID=3126391 RepID=UPI0032E49BF7